MASTKGSKDERVFFCQCGLDLETGTLIENLDWERVKISKGFFLVISDRMEQRTSRKRTRSVSERRASKAVSSKKIAQVRLSFLVYLNGITNIP